MCDAKEKKHKPVQAVEHLLLSALKLLAHLLQCLLINHITAIRSVFWEQILGEILFKPLILPENGERRTGKKICTIVLALLKLKWTVFV